MLTDIPRHRSVISQVLKEIVTHPGLKNSLGFKGGTSLFFLENLPRFSTDLDFDLIASDCTDNERKEIDT
jgi:predicted nucleotidyltransferase component of viral defense system